MATVPFRLHVHTICPDGSPEWSPEWGAWLEQAGIRHAPTKATTWRGWWNDEYIIGRCVAHAQSPNATFALDEMNLARDYYNYKIDDPAPPWVRKARDRVCAFVKKHLYASASRNRRAA